MKIEENKVFIFSFPYENTTLTIPVRGESRADAITNLQKFLSSVQVDLSMESIPVNTPRESPVDNFIPPEVKELQIIALLEKLAQFGVKHGKTTQESVEKLLKMEYKPESYAVIIEQLEKMHNDLKKPTK